MKMTKVLSALFLALALFLTGCTFNPLRLQGGGGVVPTATSVPPVVTPAAVKQAAQPMPSPTGTAALPQARAQVCTGFETGALNVRRCPGAECWVIFALSEGEEVVLSGDKTTTDDGAKWVRITRPTEGWVNAKYLCGDE